MDEGLSQREILGSLSKITTVNIWRVRLGPRQVTKDLTTCTLHCAAFCCEWKPPLTYLALGTGSRAFLCLIEGPPCGETSPLCLNSNNHLRIEIIANRWELNWYGPSLVPEDCLVGAKSECWGEKPLTLPGGLCLRLCAALGKGDPASIRNRALWRTCDRASR